MADAALKAAREIEVKRDGWGTVGAFNREAARIIRRRVGAREKELRKVLRKWLDLQDVLGPGYPYHGVPGLLKETRKVLVGEEDD